MLDRIKSFFQPQEVSNTSFTPTSTQFHPEITTTTLDDNNDATYVYIWNMTSNGPGHTAINVKENKKDEYASIVPKNMPSFGPTAILPLEAEIITDLHTDMKIEGTKRDH